MDTSSRPYNIYTYKPDYFAFTTDAGTEYECNFYSAAEYFRDYPELAPHVFLFNVSRIAGEVSKGVDDRIRLTVVKIVAGFLASKTNAVVYVCDTSDGCAAARFKKFTNWYSYANPPFGEIVQVTQEVEADGILFQTALLVHRNNPLKDRFVRAYFELLDKEP